MAEELTVSEGNKEEKYATLLPQLKAIIDNESDIIAIMANVSAAIKETFDFLWVGFYRVCGSQLILGPFQGPLACTRIAYGFHLQEKHWRLFTAILRAEILAAILLNRHPVTEWNSR